MRVSAMTKRLGVLDIDDTVKIARMLSDGRIFGINKNIVDELKSKQIEDLYFLSNMDLSDMGHGRVPSLPKSYPYVTRMALVQFFESNGFTVHGVITAADLVYQQGPGAAYRDHYIPAYKECVLNPSAYAANRKSPDSYESRFNRLLEDATALHGEIAGKKQLAALNKAKMFAYLKEILPDIFSHIAYYEDDVTCINALRQIDSTIECNHVVDQATTPLYLIGSGAFEKVLSEIKNEDLTLEIFHARLSSPQLTITTLRELEQTRELCELSADFKTRFNKAVLEQQGNPDEFEAEIKRIMTEGNGRNARSTLFSTIASVVEEIDHEFYQRMTSKPTTANTSGFSILSSDLTIFEYSPKIICMFLENHPDDLKHYLMIKIAELRTLFKAIPDIADNISAIVMKDENATANTCLELLSTTLTQKRTLGLFDAKESAKKLEGYKYLISALLSLSGQCKNLVGERRLYQAEVAEMPQDVSESEEALIKKFMQRHLKRLRQDKQKLGGLFAHTNINPLDDLPKILADAMTKKGNRKLLTCIEFHWLNENGTLHDQAPQLIKDAHEVAIASINQKIANKPK